MTLRRSFASQEAYNAELKNTVDWLRFRLSVEFGRKGFAVQCNDTKAANAFRINVEKDGGQRAFEIVGKLDTDAVEGYLVANVKTVDPWYKLSTSKNFLYAERAVIQDEIITFMTPQLEKMPVRKDSAPEQHIG